MQNTKTIFQPKKPEACQHQKENYFETFFLSFLLCSFPKNENMHKLERALLLTSAYYWIFGWDFIQNLPSLTLKWTFPIIISHSLFLWLKASLICSHFVFLIYSVVSFSFSLSLLIASRNLSAPFSVFLFCVYILFIFSISSFLPYYPSVLFD